MAATESCYNCGTMIGRLETPMVWANHVVCAACHGRLSAPDAGGQRRQDALAPDGAPPAKEEVILAGQPSVAQARLLAGFLWLVGTGAAGYVFSLGRSAGPAADGTAIMAILLWVGFTLAGAGVLVRRRLTSYSITTRRLIYTGGLFVRYRHEASLAKINNVKLARGPVGFILGYASVIVETGNDDPMVIQDVPAFAALQAAIQRGIHAG